MLGSAACCSPRRSCSVGTARRLALPAQRTFAARSRAARRVPNLHTELPQLGVFRLGLLEDRDVLVGVFPESEEILVGSLALAVSPEKANALPSRQRASAPMGSLKTM